MRHDKAGVAVELLRLRQVTYTSAEPERAQRAPDISGPKGPVTKLPRRWPFGVAFFAVAQWKIFFSFNLSLTKLVLQWKTA